MSYYYRSLHWLQTPCLFPSSEKAVLPASRLMQPLNYDGLRSRARGVITDLAITHGQALRAHGPVVIKIENK